MENNRMPIPGQFGKPPKTEKKPPDYSQLHEIITPESSALWHQTTKRQRSVFVIFLFLSVSVVSVIILRSLLGFILSGFPL